jgi:cytochrome c6
MRVTAPPGSTVQYCNSFNIRSAMFSQSKLEWSLKMKRITMKLFTFATAVAVVLSISAPAHAQDAAALFKSKCAGCHAADGTGSAMGKKMGAHDFTSAEVQGMSDAQLTDIITNGKNKMPKYGSLPPEQVKGLVAYIRTLKK